MQEVWRMSELTEQQVTRTLTQLAHKMGKKNATSLLSVLGKDKQFINALDTPVGQELMKDATNCVEDKINLVLQEKDEPKDRAELKAYLTIITKWQNIINRYNKNKELFEKNVV